MVGVDESKLGVDAVWLIIWREIKIEPAKQINISLDIEFIYYLEANKLDLGLVLDLTVIRLLDMMQLVVVAQSSLHIKQMNRLVSMKFCNRINEWAGFMIYLVEDHKLKVRMYLVVVDRRIGLVVGVLG